MSRKPVIDIGALIEFNGCVGRVKQIFERPTYFVEDLTGVEMFVSASAARRISADAEIEVWKKRALDAESRPKAVTLTLERDGVINGVMCPAGQYRVTEYPNAPSIVTRLTTVDTPAQPLVHVPAEDDEPYTAVCSQCEKTENFPDEADAATDMQKNGWKFVDGNAVCPQCSG